MTVSASLKKLVSSGLVTRNEHAKDSRAKEVVLTKKGRALAKKLVGIVEDIDQAFFKNADQAALIDIFNQLAIDDETARTF